MTHRRALMTLSFIFVTALSMNRAVAQAPTDAAGVNLPKGLSPYQALAIVDRNGNLTMKVSAMILYVSPPEANDGKTKYEEKTTVTIKQYPANQVKAHDADGEPIDSKRLIKLLRNEALVLVSVDGKTVDPLHRRVYKKDTVFLVVPVATPVPYAVPPVIDAPPTISGLPVIKGVQPPPAAIRQDGNDAIFVRMVAPERHVVSTEATYTIYVFNNGKSKARNVAIYLRIPDQFSVPGLKNMRADGWIVKEIGDLDGEAHRFEKIVLNAGAKGEYRLEVRAVAEGNVFDQAETRATVVEAPPKVSPQERP